MVRWPQFVSPFPSRKVSRPGARQRHFRRTLRLETLEHRTLLSVSSPDTIPFEQAADVASAAGTDPGGADVALIQALEFQEFTSLSAQEIVYLTPQQIGTIPSDWWLRRIPDTSRGALTASQIRGLNVANTGLLQLTAPQIDALTEDQLQSLPYKQFRYLSVHQIPRLTTDQIASLPDGWWFGKISENARAALTTEQVRAINVANVGLDQLTPAQIDALSTTQVRSVNYREFRYLSPRQTPRLNEDQIASIPTGWWFTRMSEEARNALSARQVRALNVAEVGLKHLTETQRTAMSLKQIRSLTNEDFRYLSPDQTPQLTRRQISTIPDGWWFSRISDEARAALTAEQVRALKVAKVGIEDLTSAQTDALRVRQVQSLSYQDFRYLSQRQVPHLTAGQIATIPNDWWFERMSDAARASLTPEQVQAMNVAEVGIGGLTRSQVNFLSSSQVRTLPFEEFRYLTRGTARRLTPTQIGTIPDSWWFSRMSDKARAVLKRSQIRALNVAEVGLRDLTPSQVRQITTRQIQSLSFKDFLPLGPNQVRRLRPRQIASIPDGWWFSRMSEEARANLTPEQIQRINTEEISIRHLTEGRRRFLTADQIQNLEYDDFRYLSPEQVRHLTSLQMESIPSGWHMQRMSDEAQAALDRDQLLSLPAGVAASLMGLPAEFVPDVTSAAHEDETDDPGHDDPDGLPHPDDPEKQGDHLALFELVPHDAATHVTVVTGDWSDPTIWNVQEVPGPGANVLIADGTTVTFDTVSTHALHTVRIDGTLEFATDVDTQLKADTIVVDTEGDLHVGTSDEPIRDGVAARIVIADTGRIDTDWDPNLLSRGLISHGALEMVGQEVTPYAPLAVSPGEGDTELILASSPVNWRVGHRLVLTGTRANMDRNQDEEREIVAIDGRVVTLDEPLRFDHTPPHGHDLSVYVANLNRNVVVLSENPDINSRRGHVMFMHSQNVEVHNVGFYGLGRTDKRNPVNDPVLDDHGVLIEGTGLNPRGRYSVHFHQTGTSYDDVPGLVTGSAVVDSPGWGFVNHDSFVHMEDNVAFHVVGASFVTELGNEIGSFRRNLSIHTTGSGDGLEDRQEIFDFGHNGHGFWMQGPGVELESNISAGNNDAAFIFFTASSEALFDAANLADPALAAGRDQVPIGSVPLRKVVDNVAFASKTGLETWFHMTNMPDGQSVIEDFTSWNTRRAGLHTPYTGRTTIQDATILGNFDRPRGVGISRNDVTNNMTYRDVHVKGFEIGISAPVRRATVIDGGTLEAVRAIEVRSAAETIRTVDITGDVRFKTLSSEQRSGRAQFDIFLDGAIDTENRDVETLFAPDIVRLGTVRLAGKQVYYHKQAADWVPFPTDESPDFIPQELKGKTNQQLWDEFGIAPAGIVAPSDAVELDRINGLVGEPVTYLPRLELKSDKYTNELNDYALSYLDANGDRVVDPVLEQLRDGWNLVTRSVEGRTRTFFVFGDTEAPTFEFAEDAVLAVNPDGLEFGFVLRGTVSDNSFGTMHFKKRFNNLSELEVQTRADGSQFLLIEFEIRDLAGNATEVSFELNLDPNLPLVPGTDQRDLPDRDLPESLYALLEYYLIITD